MLMTLELPVSEFRTPARASREGLPVVVDDVRDIPNGVDGVGKPRHNPHAIHKNRNLSTVARRQDREARQSLPEHDKGYIRRTARIAIRSRGRIVLVDPTELVSVQAQGNYVLLQQQTGSHLLRGAISTMAERLGPYGFVRIHRSVLINRAHVEEVRTSLTGEHCLRVRSGKTFTVGRRYTGNLRFLAEEWLGTEP